MKSLPPPEPVTFPAAEEIELFELLTRDLIGVTLRSLDPLMGSVTLPQFRLLLTVGGFDACTCSEAARSMGVGASSVTRLADKLEASGHIERHHDVRNRSVVMLSTTADGKQLIADVLARRREEFVRILGQIDPAVRTSAALGLRAFHETVGDAYTAELHSQMPL